MIWRIAALILGAWAAGFALFTYAAGQRAIHQPVPPPDEPPDPTTVVDPTTVDHTAIQWADDDTHLQD